MRLIILSVLIFVNSALLAQTYVSTFSIGKATEGVMLQPKTIPTDYIWKITKMDALTVILFKDGSNNVKVFYESETGVTIHINGQIVFHATLPIWLESSDTVLFQCTAGSYITVEVYKF